MAIFHTLNVWEDDVYNHSNSSLVGIRWTSTQSGGDKNINVNTAKYWVSVNGEAEVEYTVTYTLPENTEKPITYRRITVPHRPDGTGSVTVRTWMDTGTTAGVIEKTQTLTLTAIPRAATIESLECASDYFTGKLTFYFYPKVDTYYTRCNVDLNINGEYIPVKSINLGQRSVANVHHAFYFSSDELLTIYSNLPNTSTGTLRFTVRTYSDADYSNEIGDGAYKEITLSIPNNSTTQPTMTMTLSPEPALSTANRSLYISGVSKVKASFTNAQAKLGASIVSYKLTVNGKDYDSPYISDVLTQGIYAEVKGTVTDSRGFSTVYTDYILVNFFNQPRISSISCSTEYFNGAITFKHTSPNSTSEGVFYLKYFVYHSIDETLTELTNGTIGKTISVQEKTFTLSSENLKTIYQKITHGVSGKLLVRIQAYIGSGYSEAFGTSAEKEITLKIPDDDSTKPTATLSVSPVTSLNSAFSSLYIKGKTKATANLANGEGKYGATIKSYAVTIGAQRGTPPLTSSYLTLAGNVTVTGTVTDSRGFARIYSTTINVIDYSSPQILPVSGQNSVIVARCNAQGTIDENGTYLLIAAKRSYSKVVSEGVQKNFCTLQYRVKVEGGSYSSWETFLAKTSESDEIITGALTGVTLETTRTYVVQIRAVDDIGEQVTTQMVVSTQNVYLHKAGSMNSFGIGKYAEKENTIDIAEDITTKFRGKVQFAGEEWVNLGLAEGVAESEHNVGRWGNTGCYYRVCAGEKHIYVAFNCAFTFSGSEVQINSEPIPTEYRPDRNVYAICATDGRLIAQITVNKSGNIYVDWIQVISSAEQTTSSSVQWIDGYIDYWT